MNKKSIRRFIIGGLTAAALLCLGVPIAKLATNSSEILEACINPGNGMMRLVDESTACHKNETRVSWNVEGPQGPPGPQGDPGPPGTSSGGPPFVWVCTPITLPNAGSNSRGDIYVFNGSANTANVGINFLDVNGANLQGHTVPGSADTYPGEAGVATVPLAATHTRQQQFTMPVLSGVGDGVTDVAIVVRVTSDQPVVVASNFQFSGFMPNVCHEVPK